MRKSRAAGRERKIEIALAHLDLAKALLEDVCGRGVLCPGVSMAVLDRLTALADVVDPDMPVDVPDEEVRPAPLH